MSFTAFGETSSSIPCARNTSLRTHRGCFRNAHSDPLQTGRVSCFEQWPSLEAWCCQALSRKSATIFGTGTIPEPSGSHIGKGVALVAQTTTFVYIYARIPQIAEMTLSFHATHWMLVVKCGNWFNRASAFRQ